MTLAEAYLRGVSALEAAGVPDAAFDCGCLVASFCGYTHAQRIAHASDRLSETAARDFLEAVRRRADGEPLQYILGDAEFFGYTFKVNKNVLIPRFETELLVDKALPYIGADSRVLDMCCGSGAIGITVALKKGCPVTLADVSEGAIRVAKSNAAALGADVRFVLSDMFEKVDGVFDVIICNPPYIPSADIQSLDVNVKDYEPVSALDGGRDGLDFYRRIAERAPAALSDGGVLALELGAGQAEEVKRVTSLSFDVDAAYADYNGIDRILILRKKADSLTETHGV